MLCTHIYPYKYNFSCIICVPFKNCSWEILCLLSPPLLLDEIYAPAHLSISQMQNRLLVGNDVKVRGFPDGVTQQIAHLLLLCDDDEIRAWKTQEALKSCETASFRVQLMLRNQTCHQPDSSHDATHRTRHCWRRDVLPHWKRTEDKMLTGCNRLHIFYCILILTILFF